MNTGHRSKQTSSLDPQPFASEVYRAGADEHQPDAVDSLRIDMRNEVRALRTLIGRSSGTVDLARELVAIRAAIADMATETPKKGDRVMAWLRARGIEGPVANRIGTVAKAKDGGETLERIRAAIGETVALAPWVDDYEGRRIVAAVGSSGVGKTTTVAKLAARARIKGKSVSLVSCDSFRVGAVDQLERYAELLGAAFHVARTASELAAVLEQQTADVVFVDTSGRPPEATAPEAALAARRKKGAPVPVEVLLCLAASTRGPDAVRIASTFAPVTPTLVCVTKLDETVSPAGLVVGPWAARLPLALICNGPRVPEDVAPADLDVLVRALSAAESA